MAAPYTAAIVQSLIRHVGDPATKRATIRENVHRNLSMIEYVAHRFGGAKLFVMPEFSLTGAEHVRSVDDWTKVALQIPGEETEILGQAAREMNIYIAGGTMEYDPEWPNRWFNSAFIIDPSGDVILRYRKLNGADVQGHTHYTTPGSIHDAYLERYGIEGLFPVVDTPIGKLACLLCYDINFPEVARALALRGAEILIYPTGEPYGAHRQAWEQARRTRAYENLVYLISANHGMYAAPVRDGRFLDDGSGLFEERVRGEVAPLFRSHGESEIVDYQGRVLAVINGPGEALITAPIDIEALRLRRAQARSNFLAQLRADVYAPFYAQAEACPINHWLERPIHDRREGAELTRSVIRRFQERGTYVPPEGYDAPAAPDGNGRAAAAPAKMS
jgi:predicted amidohydrolase